MWKNRQPFVHDPVTSALYWLPTVLMLELGLVYTYNLLFVWKPIQKKYFEHLQYPSFNSFEVLPFSLLKDDFRNTNFHIMWEIIVKGTRGGNQHLYHQQLLCDCDCYNHLLKIENEGVFNRYLQRCNFALLTKNKNHDYYMVKKCKSLGYISPTLKKFCRFC